MPETATRPTSQKAVLVNLEFPGSDYSVEAAEFRELVRASGAEITALDHGHNGHVALVATEPAQRGGSLGRADEGLQCIWARVHVDVDYPHEGPA